MITTIIYIGSIIEIFNNAITIFHAIDILIIEHVSCIMWTETALWIALKYINHTQVLI